MLNLIPVMMSLLVALMVLSLQLTFMAIKIVFGIIRLIFQIFTGGSAEVIEPFAGKAYVIDGDTLAFGDKRVRIFGMDAPETDQEQGPIATNAMRALVGNKNLQVRPIELDRYNRIVARVYLDNGQDIATHMVRGGWAIAETKYSRDYVKDMRIAKRNKAGFWAMRGGIANPQAFRATQK